MTRGRQLWHEVRFLLLGLVAVGAAIYAAVPPVSISKIFFKTFEASPGEIITLQAEGYWWRQCPATIYGRWIDPKNNQVVYVDKPIDGGRAQASFKRQVNLYRKQVPLSTTYGFRLPDRICYQTLSEHRCGIFPTSSKSPLACLRINQ